MKIFWRLAILMMFATGCGSESSTSDPSPMADASLPDAAMPAVAPMAGATWFVDTESGRWVTPQGTERFLSLAPDGLALWLSVSAVQAATFDFMLAVGNADGQDRCARTIVMPNLALGADGHFQFGPADFSLPNGTTAEELVLEGRFSEDMSQITEISARGRLVVTSVPADVLPLMDGVDPCGVVSALLQTDCIACRDGQVECLDIEVADYVGSTRPATSVSEVLLSDCHPDCAASAENMDCDLPDP